jgi:quinol monooxygenase YgiN
VAVSSRAELDICGRRDPDNTVNGPPVAKGETAMELFIFARFHARAGNESGVAAAILDGLAPTRAEPGCISSHGFRSIRDPQLFFIHSRWRDQAAFELHATLPHTVRFLDRVEPLIDHPLDVNRTEQIG